MFTLHTIFLGCSIIANWSYNVITLQFQSCIIPHIPLLAISLKSRAFTTQKLLENIFLSICVDDCRRKINFLSLLPKPSLYDSHDQWIFNQTKQGSLSFPAYFQYQINCHQISGTRQ